MAAVLVSYNVQSNKIIWSCWLRKLLENITLTSKWWGYSEEVQVKWTCWVLVQSFSVGCLLGSFSIFYNSCQSWPSFWSFPAFPQTNRPNSKLLLHIKEYMYIWGSLLVGSGWTWIQLQLQVLYFYSCCWAVVNPLFTTSCSRINSLTNNITTYGHKSVIIGWNYRRAHEGNRSASNQMHTVSITGRGGGGSLLYQIGLEVGPRFGPIPLKPKHSCVRANPTWSILESGLITIYYNHYVIGGANILGVDTILGQLD